MDFQSLSRRELQALCKNNKIPANMTNVAMADALAALAHVVGLEDLGKDLCQTPAVRGTAPRTTTRRKPTMEQESGSIQSTRTRCVMTKSVAEKMDEEEENMNINSLQTPAASSTRRRAPAASCRTKLASETTDKKKAPAGDSLQSAYNTRRSTRLLEKTMAKLTLTGKRTAEPHAIDEEAPTVMNMTEKETIKPIKMEELHAEGDMSKGISDVEEEYKVIEDETICVISETESKREMADNNTEEDKDIEEEKSTVIPETESKREVMDVSDLEEATKEVSLDNNTEEDMEDIAATNGDAVESSKPSLDMLVEEGNEIKDEEVESEERKKSLPDAQEVEEAADLEVFDDEAIVAPVFSNVTDANANEKDESTQFSIGFTGVTSVSTPVSSVRKMKEKASAKEEPLLQVYADPESVAANITTPTATLKSSSKIHHQSALVDEKNKENNIPESGKKVVEPLAASSIGGDGNGNSNAVEVVIEKKKIAAKSLEELSLRELTKMLKEKLVINNKKEDTDEASKKQHPVEQMVGKKVMMIRQALQTLPENLQAE